MKFQAIEYIFTINKNDNWMLKANCDQACGNPLCGHIKWFNFYKFALAMN